MDKKYIDEFFDTGKLRLSSFNTYQKYEDGVKGDKSEGWNIAVGTGKKQTIFATVGVGSDAYALCTSLVYSKSLMKKFKCDSAFRIRDSSSFGLAIANKIDGLIEGMQGNCVYVKTRSTINEMDEISFEEMKNSSNQLDLGKLAKTIKKINPIDSYLMKPMRYQYQVEYRFIWLTRELANEYLEIECKEALEFCERV